MHRALLTAGFAAALASFACGVFGQSTGGFWVNAGRCSFLGNKMAADSGKFRWNGSCNAEGRAEGPGQMFSEFNGRRQVRQQTYRGGRSEGHYEAYIEHNGAYTKLSGDVGGRPESAAATADDLPYWARPLANPMAWQSVMSTPAAKGPMHVVAAPTPRGASQSAPSAREREMQREIEQLRRERETRIAQQERERQAREDEEFKAALRENEREDREAAREAQEEREARDRQWMDTAQTLMRGAAALKRQQDDQNARREAERARIEADNDRYRQMRAEEDRRWLEQNQRRQQALLDRQRAEQEYERQRRAQAMAQQREAQAAEQRRQQAEQLRRQQQEQQRAAEEARRRQQLAEDSTPRVESFWRNNVYYLRNSGSRRVQCQVSGMVASAGIGSQPGLQHTQKAFVIFPGAEKAPFPGQVGNPRFFGCRVM